MKILTVAGIVVLLFVFSFFTERPEPSVKIPEPMVSTPRVINNEPEICGDSSPIIDFSSEEELLEYISLMRAESMTVYGEIHPESEFTITHYYRLKNPPPETELKWITLLRFGITLEYDTESDEYERVMIKHQRLSDSFDIETKGLWIQRPFPNESYIREIDGITYYIAKATGLGESVLLWSIEWVTGDDLMYSEFPYDRFTADEVLAYVSDLERVEIG